MNQSAPRVETAPSAEPPEMLAGTSVAPRTYRVVIATSSPGILQSVTTRYPGLTVNAYPLPPHLLVQAFGPEVDLARARDALHETGVPFHDLRTPGRLTMILEEGEVVETVSRRLADRAAPVVPPIQWVRGVAQVTLLLEESTDPEQVRDLFPDVRLLSKRTMKDGAEIQEALGSPLFLADLTEKQAKALQAAFEAGYYDQPRRATAEDVSQALGVGRSTFLEHLHKAELHVLRAMLPVVRMRAGEGAGTSESAEGALALYSQFSGALGLYVQLEVLEGRVRRVRLAREPAGRTSHPYLTRILEHLRTGKEDLSDIPLDLQVGPFDQEVLAFLQTLRPGTTITYGEIARRLGRPQAARAVGNACAHNPVPIIIPCHRVVPASGGIGEYSGGEGPETKRKLLDREGADLSDRE